MKKIEVPYGTYIIHEATPDKELSDRKFKMLSESTIDAPGGHKVTVIEFESIAQVLNTRNWNGREYDDVLPNSIRNNPIIQEDLKNGTWGGEYGHPLIEKNQNDVARQLTIFAPNVSHIIKEWRQDGNNIMIKVMTAPGNYGDTMRDRAYAGIKPMFSSRALGGVDARGKVLPNFTFVTWDSVFRPSHKEAIATKGYKTIECPTGSTMTESCIEIPRSSMNEAIKTFVLDESHGKLLNLCECFGLDYSTLKVDGKNIAVNRLTENTVETIIIPIKSIIATNYGSLFS